jgi:hypothetical protein
MESDERTCSIEPAGVMATLCQEDEKIVMLYERWRKVLRSRPLDVAPRLAFVAGEENHKLAVVDLTSMQTLATYPVGKNPDVLAFDPGLKRSYVSAESGTVTVFRENGKALVQEGTLSMPHAHTVCVDPDSHLLYFPLQSVDGRPVLRIMEPSQTH